MSLVHLDIWIILSVFPRPSYQIRLLRLKNWVLITQLSLILIPGFFGEDLSVWGRRELERSSVDPGKGC